MQIFENFSRVRDVVILRTNESLVIAHVLPFYELTN